jgi:Na+/H+ antiporter NhaA
MPVPRFCFNSLNGIFWPAASTRAQRKNWSSASAAKIAWRSLPRWMMCCGCPGTTLVAFATAGMSLAGVGIDTLLHPVSLGIAAGLFFGKQLRIFTFCWAGVKLGWAALPEGIAGACATVCGFSRVSASP